MMLTSQKTTVRRERDHLRCVAEYKSFHSFHVSKEKKNGWHRSLCWSSSSSVWYKAIYGCCCRWWWQYTERKRVGCWTWLPSKYTTTTTVFLSIFVKGGFNYTTGWHMLLPLLVGGRLLLLNLVFFFFSFWLGGQKSVPRLLVSFYCLVIVTNMIAVTTVYHRPEFEEGTQR